MVNYGISSTYHSLTLIFMEECRIVSKLFEKLLHHMHGLVWKEI